jgi:hypothetical protein
MTATPISDSPGELFDILNTLIPDAGQRFMKFDEFRRRFTDATGEINNDGRDYFQERAKGLISYLNREYDPTTFAQPEFHTIPVPAGELAPPAAGALADMCLAGEPVGAESPEAAAQRELDAALAELPPTGKERKKAEAAARRTYKAAVAAANKTRKARLRVCYNKQKGDYKKAAGSVQTPAIEACFSGKKAAGTKFPIVRDFNAAVDSRLAGGDGDVENVASIGSAGAVVGV